MIAIDNSGLANLGLPPVSLTGFAPSVTLTQTWGTNVVLTDASAFPSGDTFDYINIEITDDEGNVAKGSITAASGAVTISTTGLIAYGNYKVKAVVTSHKGCIGTGGVVINASTSAASCGPWVNDFSSASY